VINPNSQKETISLNGEGWRVNYYQPVLPVTENEFNMVNLRLRDGRSSEAHQLKCETAGWMDGFVPSDVRDVLIKNHQMNDPYWARNTNKSRWVEDMEWWYRREVIIPDSWQGWRIFLRFEGVDYRAEYFWDGKSLGQSSDMFVPVEFELTENIELGPHVLAVCLDPQPESTCNHFSDGRIPPRAYHHKMQCAWGWDWSRPMVSIGIWDSVSIYTTGSARIRDVFVQGTPLAINGKKKSPADVKVQIETQGDVAASTIQIELFDSNNERVSVKELPTNAITEYLFRMEDAQLWWPNGYGDQSIYKARVRLIQNTEILDEREVEFGIRELRMLPNDDSPVGAYNLTYVINGVKIFATGANWVPCDLLPARIDEPRYDLFLRQVRDIGFTMLRVWGGGLIEKETFYRLCDRYGIMVWQEFPLSCANYPQTKAFLDAKTVEADAVVRKLRNHPCVILWCGGNEIDYYGVIPWHPVYEVFRTAVEQLHPGVDFHLTSPDRSRPGEANHGPWTYFDHAFWNGHFRNFNSEFGCMAPPAVASLKKFIPDNELWPDGPSMDHHYTQANGYGALEMFSAKTLDENVFFAQMMQADTLQYVVGLYRSRQFRSSGTLIWQFQSAWPEGAYSIVDYYGQPKMAYYWLKQACQPRTLVIVDDGWEVAEGKDLVLKVFAVNGLPEKLDGEVSLEVWSQAGRKVHEEKWSAHVTGLNATQVGSVAVPSSIFERGAYLVRAIFRDETGKSWSIDRLYAYPNWVSVNETMQLPLLKVDMISSNRINIQNSDHKVAMVVELRSSDLHISDNFFNLLPGEVKSVECSSSMLNVVKIFNR
jgi:beta-mannosidase